MLQSGGNEEENLEEDENSKILPEVATVKKMPLRTKILWIIGILYSAVSTIGNITQFARCTRF
jgi:hypothetical protein